MLLNKQSNYVYYYFGARYLDPRTSRWLSTDPAMGDYIPSAPINDEAKKRNGNLPGMGGVFNTLNLHTYHYSFNNPIKYIDPNGETGSFPDGSPEQNEQWEKIQNARLDTVQILIERNSEPGLFNYTISIQISGRTIFQAPVQSEADILDPRLTDVYHGQTLDEGIYTGKLMEQSASYKNPILLKEPDFLIHPNEYTADRKVRLNFATNISNGPFRRNVSAGCQVMSVENFNEMIDTLKQLGFTHKGRDTIPVIIMNRSNN